jgi:protein O-mannosyl-transferase
MKRNREKPLQDEGPEPESLNGPFSSNVILAVAAVPILAAWFTYAPHLDGDFLFDDVPTVKENQAIHKGDWEAAAFQKPHSPISNRPLTCLTFVFSHGWHGLNPRGYHIFSLVVHLANVGLLFGIVRRTLRGPILERIFNPPMALFTAAGLALPWAVHPLSSEAVTYITQRSTLLMSFFMLLAVYCLLRGSRSTKRRLGWDIGAIGACVCGMMCKEEFIGVPLLLILFERAYLHPDWSAIKERWGTYLGLVGTMLVVWICAVSGPPNPTVGYQTVPAATAGEWLMTEAHVLVHYLRLAALPYPLVGAYDWPIVRDLSEAVVPGTIVLVLLAATIYLWFTRPWWGWLGAMFFLLLAPTSSVLPIISEIAAERRMYLPVLIYTVPTVIGFTLLLDYLRRRYDPSLTTCLAVLFAVVVVPNGLAMYGAAQHAAVFRNEATFWADVAKWNPCENKSFQAGLILSAYGKVVREQGKIPEALELFRRAIECENPTIEARGNYAAALVDAGRIEEAQRRYRELLDLDPTQENPALGDVRGNYAWSLLITYQNDRVAGKAPENDPRPAEAEAVVRTAIHLRPYKANYYNTLAIACFHQGDMAGAEQAFFETLKRDENHVHARENLIKILAAQGRTAEAAQLARRQTPKQ